MIHRVRVDSISPYHPAILHRIPVAALKEEADTVQDHLPHEANVSARQCAVPRCSFIFFAQIDAVARGMYGIDVVVSAIRAATHRQTENPPFFAQPVVHAQPHLTQVDAHRLLVKVGVYARQPARSRETPANRLCPYAPRWPVEHAVFQRPDPRVPGRLLCGC
jgi:hypothetical protein